MRNQTMISLTLDVQKHAVSFRPSQIHNRLREEINLHFRFLEMSTMHRQTNFPNYTGEKIQEDKTTQGTKY